MTGYNINEPMEISGKEVITPKGEATTMDASLPQSRANHLHPTDYEKERI